MKTIFLAWQDPDKRSWWPVGRLRHEPGKYEFVYTRGAQQSEKFVPLAAFPDLHAVYESSELFPLFANRLLSKARPEYKEYIEWLNVPQSEADPIVLLARTGGERATDSLEIFPCPERLPSGEFHVHFFVRGIRHMSRPFVSDRVNALNKGERLYLMADFQNKHDPLALAVRTDEPPLIVGYCPRYLTADACRISQQCDDSPIVTVERVNPTAPYQLRLLCSLTGCWPEGFTPCSTDEYAPLAEPIPAG